MSVIKTCNLSYVYSVDTPFEKQALNNVNLEIKDKGFVGIMGHTGSGKSTLIQHFNGLLEPTSGKVYIDGKDIWANKNDVYKYRFKVGVSFQYPEHQLFEETVFKDIAFGPKNMDLSNEEIEKRVNWAMDVVGLNSEFLERSPFELSGGQKRKVALAGVISMDPDVLVLDEPTAGLDPKSKNLLLKNIKKYHKKRDNTVILISHNMDDIAQYCSDVILMHDAKVSNFGKVDDVFGNVEALLKVGLSPPTVTQVFLLLNKQGYDVGNNVHTVDRAVKYFENKISKK